MKKRLLVIPTAVLALTLTACGTATIEEPKKDNEVTTKPVKEVVEKGTKTEKTDIWTTKYENIEWSEQWEDLHFSILKVVLTNDAPHIEENGEESFKTAIGIQFKVENKSENKTFHTYPDSMTLVTSTGEQIDYPKWFASENEITGGDIHEGVTKEGDIIWYLEKSKAEDIQWIKLTWSSDFESPDGNYERNVYKDHEVKLELKK